MKFNQRKRTKKNGGYYLAILLCLVAVGLVAWSNSMGKKEEPKSSDGTADLSQVQDELPLDEALNEMSGEDTGAQLVYASTTDSAPTTPPLSELSSTEPTETAATSALSLETEPEPEAEPEAVEVSAAPIIFTKPVSGMVIKEFSGSTLVYSKTLGDWRVHNGTDIKCEYGTLVSSAGAGTVASVSKDDRYGNVVIVRHEDGSMLYYCGLDEVSVSENDTVQSGQKLGTVGVVPCECEDEPHLHLMAMREGEFVEPLSAFGLSY